MKIDNWQDVISDIRNSRWFCKDANGIEDSMHSFFIKKVLEIKEDGVVSIVDLSSKKGILVYGHVFSLAAKKSMTNALKKMKLGYPYKLKCPDINEPSETPYLTCYSVINGEVVVYAV